MAKTYPVNCVERKSHTDVFVLLISGSTQGYYVYIETSSPRKANETARLSSVVFRPSGQNDSCFMRFWFHMFGKDVDTLSIRFRTSVTGPLRTIWNKTGKKSSYGNDVNTYFKHFKPPNECSSLSQ